MPQEASVVQSVIEVQSQERWITADQLGDA